MMASFKNVAICCTLAILCGIWSDHVDAAKTCQEMIASGAEHHPEANGHYTRYTDHGCHGRDAYEKQNGTGSPLYLFFYKDSIVELGWLISPILCSDQRDDGILHVNNLNQRPDRVLIGWREYDPQDDVYFKNRDFKVECTEGLTYPQIVGIICGVILGVALIAGIGLGVYYFCRK